MKRVYANMHTYFQELIRKCIYYFVKLLFSSEYFFTELVADSL